MKRAHLIAAAGAAAITLAGGAVAFAGSNAPTGLDDGKDLASQASVSEAQAIAAARTAAAGAAALTLAGGAVAFAGSGAPSRLDDGKDLASQASVTEAQAIAAARSAASGALNEVDLEHRDGTLVYNVDVGAKDVKVDAQSGKVVAVDADD